MTAIFFTISITLGLGLALVTLVDGKTPPNIVFILADDLGWHDVGFHGSEIKTPNIDRLAYEGVILNNYYVQPICTPTRAALLTGKYPIHTGLQHYVIVGTQPYGLPLSEQTLPQRLKSLGYSTHMVGKWHLGFFKEEYLPENRGFDMYMGYYMGHSDYFDHYSEDGSYIGYDLHHNGRTVWNQSEVYSTELFTRHAENVIKNHNQSEPLFLYLAHQAVHAGNHGDPIQVPQSYVNRFPYIKNLKRRLFAGVVSALDDSVGAVYKALQENNMADNTIIVFSTDNGGPTNGYDGNAACNWPLRGCKNSLWQGGVRGVGLVHSPLIQRSGTVSEGMMHVVDWLPTLLQAARGEGFKPKEKSEQQGGKSDRHTETKRPEKPGQVTQGSEFKGHEEDLGYAKEISGLDGIGMWSEIAGGQQGGTWPRQEVLLNIDPVGKFRGIVVGDFKLISGKMHNSGWYPPPRADEPSRTDRGRDKNASDETNTFSLFFGGERFNSPGTEGSESQSWHEFESKLVGADALLFTSEANLEEQEGSKGRPVTVDCGHKTPTNCDPGRRPCLFNLREDPCEYRNLAPKHPGIVRRLLQRLRDYEQTMVTPGNKPEDPRGNPQLHGGVWVPWL